MVQLVIGCLNKMSGKYSSVTASDKNRQLVIDMPEFLNLKEIKAIVRVI